MQRCRRNDVSAVRRKVICRRVRLTLPHRNAISQVVPLARAFRPKAMRGRIALQKHFPHTAGRQCTIDGGACSFSSGNRRTFGVRTACPERSRMGVLASLFRILDASSLLAQKLSGTLIRSVLNEYTVLIRPSRAFVSNQEAEHHGY
jgi:hypothetical protein